MSAGPPKIRVAFPLRKHQRGIAQPGHKESRVRKSKQDELLENQKIVLEKLRRFQTERETYE